MKKIPKNELKAVCMVIGCSGSDPEMCMNKIYNCKIIRKIFCKPGERQFVANIEKLTVDKPI